jgi:hypothetical protein
MRRTLIAGGLVVLWSLAVNISSFAATGTTCTDTLVPGTYGAVTVPAGATCIISEGPITIRGGVSVGEGATFAFGSEETPNVTATISGGIRSSNAASVQVHFARINGGIDLQGGAGPFGGPFDVTWNTIEDSTINGAVSIEGYNGFWQGFFRNTVHGSVDFNDNTVVDVDGNELQTNTIHGSLNCAGNDPAPQQGDSGGSANQVTGAKTGQCANL